MEEYKPKKISHGLGEESTISPMQTGRQIGENLENKRKLLELLKAEGFDVSDKEQLENLAYNVLCQINRLFAEKYNVYTSEEELPNVWIREGETPAFAPHKDNKKQGVVRLGGIGAILNGNFMAEEISHFYRSYFEPEHDSEEYITQEFFGFLGKRLWQKLVPDLRDGLRAFIDHDEQYVRSRKQALEFSRSNREVLSVLNFLKEGYLLQKEKFEGKLEKIETSIQSEQKQRRSTLIHQRGYEYASKVDLDRIHNWRKLFSMPNEEVRRRFFTHTPDYSDL